MAPFPATTPSRRDRQQAFARGLAVAVAALLTANGVVMAERLTGENISQVVGLNGDKAEEAAPEGSGMLERMLRAVEAGRNQGTTGDTTVTTTGLVLGADPGVSGPTSTSPGETGTNSTGSSGGRPPGTRGPRPNVVGGSSSTTGPPPTAGGGGGGGSSSTTAPRPGTPTTTAPVSKPNLNRLEQAVEDIGIYVQQARGLTFKRSVNVRVMSQGDFQSRINRLRKLPGQDQIQTLQGILKALGVIADNVDLGAELAKLARQEVLAVYDPGADEIILPTEDPTPMLRTVLAGELTSAIQHQWFNLVRPNLDSAEDESRDGFRALVAGSASTISDAYMKSLNPAEQAQVTNERKRLASQMPQDIPESVIAEFTFPYVAGPSVVAAIMTNGGSKRLDAAFSSPPTTSEQLFEPNRYLNREGPMPVNYPAADGAVIRKGVLGQLNLLLMLNGVDNQTATQAASGWGGDRFVAWRDGSRTCIRANIVMDNPEDSQQLAPALQKWVTTRPGAQVEGSGPFTITSCA
jgi:hypothetical protein